MLSVMVMVIPDNGLQLHHEGLNVRSAISATAGLLVLHFTGYYYRSWQPCF